MGTVKQTALDYFVGGVPTGAFFQMTLADIRGISNADRSKDDGINRLQELCFMGALSYFEAFCKDHFAATINMAPSLIRNLKIGGQDVTVDASHVALYGTQTSSRIGFVLASKFDFGTPQKINALFRALLKITPFSKEDAKQFEKLLQERNLLVHHGGVFTISFLEQLSEPQAVVKQDAFFNSRVVGKKEVSKALVFIESIAKKLTVSTHSALVGHLKVSKRRQSRELKSALAYMRWSDD